VTDESTKPDADAGTNSDAPKDTANPKPPPTQAEVGWAGF